MNGDTEAPASQEAAEQDGLPTPQRYWAAATVFLALLMAIMDGAIANVALPTIARDVHATAAESIWVVNAYQLVITMLLLPLASLGEVYGYRRVYQLGLGVFTLGSLACALSDSLLTLALARVLQGVGAAGIMSVNIAITRFIYPRALLGRGIALNVVVGATSSAIGPSVAAAILSVAPWEWLFAVNVPVGILATVIALRSLPASPRSPHGFDVASAVLSAVFFGLMIASMDCVAHGIDRLAIGAGLAVMGVAGVVLVRRQLSRQSPLLPIDLLGIPMFRMSMVTSVASFAAQMLAYVSLPFLLQHRLGLTEVESGLLLTPWPLTIALVSPIAGRLSDRYAAGTLGAVGLLILAAGLLLAALLPPDASYADIAWRMGLCGLGFGLFQAPNNRALLQTAPRHRSGAASGVQATARLLGQSLGAALAALHFTLSPEKGMVFALFAGAGVALVAAGLSSLRLADPGGS